MSWVREFEAAAYSAALTRTQAMRVASYGHSLLAIRDRALDDGRWIEEQEAFKAAL